MNSAKAHIIFNPVAGGGKAQKMYPELRAQFKYRIGDDYRIYTTKKQGDAINLAARISSEDIPLIICAGGDGTINEVVNGLFDQEKLINPEIELGIINCGTGSGFAQSLCLPDTLSDQIDLILNAQGKSIDLGHCTFLDKDGAKAARFFVSECQLGIGSAVVSKVNSKHKNWGGKIAFGYITLKEVFKCTKYPMKISYNGTDISGNMIGIVIGNGNACGGGMKLTPSARINDSLLDLLVMHEMNIPELVRQFTKIYSGTHIKSDRFTYVQTSTIRIGSEVDVLVETDGELLGTLPVEIKVIPKSLKVKCNI